MPLLRQKPVLSQADLQACRALLKGGSKTFHAASRLLPRSVCEPAAALYAFCRVADDAIDLDGSLGALALLHLRLDAIYAGHPMDVPADRALAAVVEAYGIPRALPAALLDGFAWDREGRRYQTIAALEDYAARVAGSVGAMMALLMGVREPEVVARACDLGVAMQLSNIARDVGEDARAGRLYLPLDWLHEAGVEPGAWLRQPAFDARIGVVVRRLLERADTLYRRSESGIARLPLSCRPGIGAARYIYAEIGAEVLRHGGDSISRRAVVSGRRKLALLARSLGAIALPAATLGAPPLEATRYLVEAIPRRARMEDYGIGRLMDLFMVAETRQQIGRQG